MDHIERTFINHLKPVFEKHGFRYRASFTKFVSPKKFGFLQFSWGSLLYSGSDAHFGIEPGLGVRHDVVDNIINNLGHIWGEKNRLNTKTVYRSLSLFPFESKRGSKISIRNSCLKSDIEKAAEIIDDVLLREGKSFLTSTPLLLNALMG